MHAADMLASLPPIPAPPPISRAPHPVRTASESRRVAPPAVHLTKKEAVRLWYRARAFEARTRRPGASNGALTRMGVIVLHSLLVDFMSFSTGQCDPSAATISRKAGISVRSVYRGLAALQEAGVITWIRRCRRTTQGGREVVRQISNAYMILREAGWRGYTPPQMPPRPDPWTLGMVPSPLDEAVQSIRLGASQSEVTSLLDADPGHQVMVALAGLSRAMMARKADCQTGTETS